MKKPPAVALITGAARRIGAEIARVLHAAGMNVVIHYQRSEGEARQLADELNRSRPDSARVLACDLLDTPKLPALVRDAHACWGRLDALVNNASGFYPTPLGEIGEAAWNDLIGSNLKAPLFLSQAAAPALRETQGAIVNLLDVHVSRPLPDHTVYAAAKGGLLALTRALARDLAPAVRVNAVSPGTILWPEHSPLDDTEKAAVIGATPLKRIGTPADIAKTVRFLLSEDAAYITGQVIAVDGGRGIGWA
jgi:pteridine reductase